MCGRTRKSVRGAAPHRDTGKRESLALGRRFRLKPGLQTSGGDCATCNRVFDQLKAFVRGVRLPAEAGVLLTLGRCAHRLQ